MKVLVLSLLSAVALGVNFNTHASCTGYEAACTGTTGDATTCIGQDAAINAGLAAEGIDATTATSWTVASAQALARHAHVNNWNNNGVFGVHIDLEPIYRCTMEANSLVWSVATACFDEWGSCLADATCAATWDGIANTTAAAAGVTFTRIGQGVQALGSIPFTPINDHTTSPMTAMTAVQLGTMVAVSDMSGNGKIMAMNACMLKNWVVDTANPNGVDIQAAYEPCFDIGVACSLDADCAAASVKTKDCAADEGITMATHPMLTNVWANQLTASHDDMCAIGNCASEVGNSLYLALGTCTMDVMGYSFKKCYDDMMGKLVMMFGIIGGCSFASGVLMFTGAWCLCCKNKNKGLAHETV